VRKAPYTVDPLSQFKMSWLMRQRLRWIRDRHGTGLLLQGIIRTASHSMSLAKPSVSVREGETRLGMVTSSFQVPKWVPLAPGEHSLTFHAVRLRSSSSFTAKFTVAHGEVLVAVCEPIQPWTIFGKSPSVDHWYLGVIPQDGTKVEEFRLVSRRSKRPCSGPVEPTSSNSQGMVRDGP
jgi:hypothetical protein